MRIQGLRSPRQVVILCLALYALLVSIGCQHQATRQPLAMNHFVDGSVEPAILAAYQPWFGQSSHINVGYSSMDRVKIEQQIDRAKQLGITGFVVNWYGPRHD